MKTVVPPNIQSFVLNQWRGSDAKLWMYHVTHKRIALMLSRPSESEVLYVVAIGCEWMKGPFFWRLADISIAKGEVTDSNEPICQVLDAQADFELFCSSVTLVRGPATDLDNSFENFLGDARKTD